ncbi:MAG TPA: C-GCAxxG-C-C family protein [Methanocorpusculum sp.]|nr:C-GCAxxG-C-C family protein [Methanocorpusculum sp.]
MTLPFYFQYSGADALEIRRNAEELFRSGKYYCSEAVMSALREAFFPELPGYVISSVSGFPVGMGGSGCACGAAVGAVSAIGLIFGRESPSDVSASAHCMQLARELHETFAAKHRVICCRVLSRGAGHAGPGEPHKAAHCIEMTGDAAEAAARLILREAAKAADAAETADTGADDGAAPLFTADSKVTEILLRRPEAAEVLTGYGMTCLASVIANDETLRIAVTHKNLPLDKICKELGIRYP